MKNIACRCDASAVRQGGLLLTSWAGEMLDSDRCIGQTSPQADARVVAQVGCASAERKVEIALLVGVMPVL